MDNIQIRDVITGTVYAETRKGVMVSSDELPSNTVCYCPGCLKTGDKALFTIKTYTYTDGAVKVLLSFDSMLEYAA